MTLSTGEIAEIHRRAVSERRRDAHPADFPTMPPVPAARYGDADFARLERDAVFGRSWLFVAHLDELPEPGAYKLLDQIERPVLLLRGRDDRVRAFDNTCMHRGAALVTEPSGTTGRRLTCPYHSWVYDLDGTLVGYPDPGNFRELDPECTSLTEHRCERWGPLVFMNLDPDAEPLETWLGRVGEELSEMADLTGRLHLAGHTVREVPVNWKIPVDANIETYHVNTVHRRSAGEVLDQAATTISLFRGGHSRMFLGLKEGVPLTGRQPFPPLFEGLGDLPDSGTFSYHLFPNLSIVFVGLGFLFLITNWPRPDGTSSYHVHWCCSADLDTDEGRSDADTFIGFNQKVLFEDLSVLPGMQRSIDAGTIDILNLNYQERRIQHVHETIDHVIGTELIPEELRVRPVLGPHLETRS